MVKSGGDNTGCVYAGLDIHVKMLLFLCFFVFCGGWVCVCLCVGVCVCVGGGGLISTGFGVISMKSYVPSAMQLDYLVRVQYFTLTVPLG